MFSVTSHGLEMSAAEMLAITPNTTQLCDICGAQSAKQ